MIMMLLRTRISSSEHAYTEWEHSLFFKLEIKIETQKGF